LKSYSYKDLIVWQKAIKLVVEIYAVTDEFPHTEIYSLSLQMRRAGIAIVSNIAEGQKRGHNKEFLQFLYIAYDSGAELEAQIEICKNLPKMKDLDYTKAEELLVEVMKMLNGLIRSLKNRS